MLLYNNISTFLDFYTACKFDINDKRYYPLTADFDLWVLSHIPASTNTVPAICQKLMSSLKKITAIIAPATGSILVKTPISEAVSWSIALL